MKILLADKKPICERPKRFPLVEQEIINKEVRQYLDNDIRWSPSDFTAPVIPNKEKETDKKFISLDRRYLKVRTLRRKHKIIPIQ